MSRTVNFLNAEVAIEDHAVRGGHGENFEIILGFVIKSCSVCILLTLCFSRDATTENINSTTKNMEGKNTVLKVHRPELKQMQINSRTIY